MRNRIRNFGILSAFCVVAAALSILTGCDSGAKEMLLAAEVDLTSGNAMQAIVLCLEEGSYLPVDSATVTVNGLPVPASFLGNISYSLNPAAAAGEDVTMHFSFEDIDIQKTLVMPEKPFDLASTDTDSDQTILITWSLVNNAQDHVVVFIASGTRNGDTYSVSLPGSATSHTIPAKTLKAGQFSVPVIVEAMNSTTNLGSSVGAGSVYQVANQGEVDIDTDP